jgi:hypothetical protein
MCVGGTRRLGQICKGVGWASSEGQGRGSVAWHQKFRDALPHGVDNEDDDGTRSIAPPPTHPTPAEMPPRLQATRLALSLLSVAPRTRGPAAATAQPLFVAAQQRCASILSSLSDNQGAYNKKIRRGRGPASGKGKTGGRGQKGQHAHGKVPAGFEGGQTPQSITNPERGRGKYNP